MDGNIRTATATRRFSCQWLHVNSAQTYEAAALAGLGLIKAPLLGIGRYLESGALWKSYPIFVADHSPCPSSLHTGAICRAIRAFMKWIEDVLTPYLE